MFWQLGPPQRAGEHSNDPSPHCLCAGTNIVVRAMLPLPCGFVNMFARAVSNSAILILVLRTRLVSTL